MSRSYFFEEVAISAFCTVDAKEFFRFRLPVLNLLETDSFMLYDYMFYFVISGGMIEFVFSVIYINESLFILNLYLGI